MTTTELLKGAKVETFQLVNAQGRHIRRATQVVLADGRRVRFIEKMSKADALRNVAYQIERGHLDHIAI